MGPDDQENAGARANVATMDGGRNVGALDQNPRWRTSLGSQSDGEQAVCYERLRPVALVRMLNATPLGTVISDRKVRRHRDLAGFRIGTNRHIDLFRYVAWLVACRHIPSATIGRRKTPVNGAPSAPGLRAMLERQHYCCALSGRPLTPDSTALDHILPVSRGGGHTLENVQVLSTAVNRAKHTLTNEEFIQLCREVVAHVDA